MKIRSPPGLHYPITVVDLAKRRDEDIERASPLFSYYYETKVNEVDKYGEEKAVTRRFHARFDAPVDGVVSEWYIKNGAVIERAGVNVAEIEEPCTHEIQFGGLCTNCGKDMTEVDYMTRESNVNRATVNMTHDNVALLVSEQEAHRAEEDAKRRLLSQRKLSLIVDLDQTVIHTTCERTVAEWQEDPANPNYDAVKDVKSFQLADDKLSNVAANWYYCKLRPGLEEFLEHVSTMYELHIYTMATRAYAQAVAKIIDPDRRYFGDRILSRDENGTDQIKTLHRLFPTNTDMVVIIDDRADIWHWSANLVRVRLYNFFTNTGDINASFLPKQEGPSLAATQDATTIEEPEKVSDKQALKEETTNGSLTDLEQQLISMGAGDNPEKLEEQVKEQEKLIISQQTERPLLQSQLKQDQKDEEDAENAENDEAETADHQVQRHAVLHNDDRELLRVEDALRRVHKTFYDEYQKKKTGPPVGRVAELKGEKSPKKRAIEEFVPDVKVLMPRLKRAVFQGTSFVISGLIPLGTDVQFSDLGLWVKSFGAQISLDINKQTTHVIANPERKTTKVKKAARYPHIKIVTLDWLSECFSKWERVPEDPYIIEVDPDEHGPSGNGQLEDLEDGILLSADDDDDDDETGLTGDEDEAAIEDAALDMSDEKWASIGDELDEFMNETDDDTEDGGSSDSESVRSDASTQSDASQTKNKKKRKRTNSSANNSEAEESDASNASGSKLQRRKKRTLERVTSLTNVVTADKSSGLPSPETTGPEEGEGQEEGVKEILGASDKGAAGDEGASDDDGMEAAMMAEFEAAEDDDDDEE